MEGTSISKDVERLYVKYKKPEMYRPVKGVIQATSKTFACTASREFFSELAELSLRKAEHELFDHFFIYKSQCPILEWWDAFSDPMILSSAVSESDVYRFASRLGMRVEKLKKRRITS